MLRLLPPPPALQWLMLLVAWVALATAVDALDPPPPLPNIVILFADNLGYEDVSIFQSTTTTTKKTRTPNIDRLGDEGMTFFNWNSAAALCSASRAALLTGKYPVRTGIYPRVFRPDAKYGLDNETTTTLAKVLQKEGYATSIVGKWHLGQRERYLPTNQGFDSWMGIPYHMSGGSVDNHTCNYDARENMWLPLYHNNTIVEQPVKLDNLATRYAKQATEFIHQHTSSSSNSSADKPQQPFFLYMAFSHVHQLCAPRDFPEQASCQWAGSSSGDSSRSSVEEATFANAVEEMDWIAGQILLALESSPGVAENTFVLFTSDNGPWVAEQACSGSKGPFEGQW
jgi:arylsulfatase A